jgi:hypothetical protein
MRSPYIVIPEVLEELNMTNIVRETIERDSGRWVIKIESLPNALIRSYIVFEIMENDGTPFGCVLKRYNCGRSSMTRIMDRVMDKLDEEESISSQSLVPLPSEAPQPSSPSHDMNGPPGGDISRSRPRHMRR